VRIDANSYAKKKTLKAPNWLRGRYCNGHNRDTIAKQSECR